MSFFDWYQNSIRRFREDGVETVPHSLYELYMGGLRTLGRHVYSSDSPAITEDWDVLVLLDACRYDILAELEPEYDWLTDCQSRVSCGGASWDWMWANFSESHADVLEDIVYVTANGNSEEHVDQRLFLAVDEVWKYT